MANAITSLRLCTTIDWRNYVEAVSLVEQALRRDPSGAYARMDFLSRDRQRQAVEELAERNGESQVRVALKAIESRGRPRRELAHPRGGACRLLPRRQGPRRPRADVGYRPRRSKARTAASSAARDDDLPGRARAMPRGPAVLAGLWYASRRRVAAPIVAATALLLIPASDLAIAIAQRVVAGALRRGALPRLELLDGVPEDVEDDRRHADPADERRRHAPRCSSISRSLAHRQSRSAHPLRDPQ